MLKEEEYYQEAINIIYRNPDLLVTPNTVTEVGINAAQNLLEINFPLTYRDFVMRFGQPTFGSTIFYGLYGDELSRGDVVDITQIKRKNFGLPKILLCVLDSGFTRYDYFIECGSVKSESSMPVLVYAYGRTHVDAKYETVADNFGKFLLNIVNQEVELNNLYS